MIHTSQDLVEAAVEFYLNARREEMQAGMRELLGQLYGSRAARIALLAGMTREELEAAGGVEEDDQRWPGVQGLRGDAPRGPRAGGAACRHAAGPTPGEKISVHLSVLTR